MSTTLLTEEGQGPSDKTEGVEDIEVDMDLSNDGLCFKIS